MAEISFDDLIPKNTPAAAGAGFGDLVPGAGMAANVGAGANELIASAAGAPVDAMTWFLNKAAEYVAGQKQPLITNPIGGSESIKSAMGLVGADPRNIVANTGAEKVAREVGAAIPATVAPYLGARAAIERGATGALPRMLGGAAGPGQSAAQTVAGALGNAAVGTGGVLGGQAAEAIAEGNSPTANLVGQLAGGMLTGGALSKAANMAARVAQPNVSPDVKLLMAEGVTPTPGQILGGHTNRFEEALTSIPLAGDAAKAARIRANEQFNRGAINRALAPIGEKLDEATPLGREAISEAGDKISAFYGKLVPTLSASVDQQFAADLTRLSQMAQFMPPDRAKQFGAVLKSQVGDKISPAGVMTGPSFKEVESELGRLARMYRNSPVGDERQLGGAFLELQSTLRDWLARSNPKVAPELAKANEAYANLLRVEGAAGKPGADPGVFTPAQLQSAVRQLDPTLRHRAFARGDALMQDYADAGRNVLGARLPDSGTPYRGLMATLLGGGLGAGAVVDPAAAMMAVGGGMGASALYSPSAQAALAAALTKRPAGAAAWADFLRGAAPPPGAAMSYPVWGALAP